MWKKGDERTIYHMIYQAGAREATFMKRFAVTGITRDKEYHLAGGAPGTRVHYFTAHPDGRAEIVRVQLRPRPNLRKTQFDVDFAQMSVKGRDSRGNLLTRNMVQKVVQKEVRRQHARRGAHLVRRDGAPPQWRPAAGATSAASPATTASWRSFPRGSYQFFPFALSTHFPDEAVTVVKWEPEMVVSAVYWDGGEGAVQREALRAGRALARSGALHHRASEEQA